MYDVNGNIVKDNNKHIHTSGGGNGITYNFLDKVDNINVNGKGSIAYVYDAAGMLLQKTASDTKSGLKTITTYVAGFVYERKLPIAGSGGTDTLQYVLHEEGRIRNSIKTDISTMTVTFGLEYDYFLKDHLGNIRTTLTEEQRTDAYPMAKMETASAASDNLYYFNIESTRTDKPNNYPVDNAYSNPNDKVAKVNGSGNKIGPSMILKVMAGDKFNLQVNSWYVLGGNTPGTPADPLSDIVAAITNSVPMLSGGKIVQSQLTSTVLNPSVTEFLNDRDGSTNTARPKAYINWILFDEQMNPVMTNDGKNSGFQQVVAGNVYKTHTVAGREITKNGYLYIYVSNETPNINVYFDQLQVTHIRGPLLQEQAYYPFGLEMKGISSQAATVTGNAYKFNGGTQLEERFDVDYYETPFRRYDAQVGRFTGVDALAEKYKRQSPYAFANNDPVYYNDPTGLDAHSEWDAWHGNLESLGLARPHIGEVPNGLPMDSYGGGGGSYDGSGVNFWNNFSSWVQTLPDGTYNIYNTPGQNSITYNNYYQYSNADGSGVFITPNFHGLSSFTEGEMYHFTGMDHQNISVDFSSFEETEGWYEPTSRFNSFLTVDGIALEKLSGASRIGSNFELYTVTQAGRVFYGNQYVKTFSLAKAGRGLGYATFGLGLVIDGIGVRNYYKYGPDDTNAVNPAKAGLNTVMGGYGLTGVGTIPAVLYFGIDTFYPGGWDGAMHDQDRLIQENRAIDPNWQLYIKDF